MRTCIACIFTVVLSVLTLSVVRAQSRPAIKYVPLSRTSPTSATEMFANYCAACHGIEGKGNGPAAVALKKQPTNLTQLAAANGGKYPELLVAETLSVKDVSAHGSKEMPVWGDLFKNMGTGDPDIARLRIVNLTSYIKSIQAK